MAGTTDDSAENAAMEASIAGRPRQRYKLTLEYVGSAFSGSQVAPGQRTVQGELEAALARLAPGETPTAVFAGRTDAGVHAVGNVAHVDLPPRRNGLLWQPEELLRALSGLRDIGISATRCVPSSFHARHSAAMRTYVYRIRCCAQLTPVRKSTVPIQTILLGAAGVVLSASLLLAFRQGAARWGPVRCSGAALMSTTAAAATATAAAAASIFTGASAAAEVQKHELAARGGSLGEHLRSVSCPTLAKRGWISTFDRQRLLALPRRLDLAAMRSAALLLEGTHDFDAFRSPRCSAKSPVRTVEELILIDERPGALDEFLPEFGRQISVRVRSRSFLHNQVTSTCDIGSM